LDGRRSHEALSVGDSTQPLRIFTTAKPCNVVLDFGAGTVILSMFAAQAGSQRVYAVERTTIVRLARRFLKRNGFDDRIVVRRGNVDRVELPEKVDVIVSGWLAMLGVEENMLAPGAAGARSLTQAGRTDAAGARDGVDRAGSSCRPCPGFR